MNEAYYNRVMSDKIVDLLKEGGKFNWLIDYVIKHKDSEGNEDLDFQTGSNSGSSWFSVYKGTGRILTINSSGRPYTIKGKEENYGKCYRDSLTTEEMNEILNKWDQNPEKGRYYINKKNVKKEGYYQNLISRRYSLYCKPEDNFIIFDKEFVIGYINTMIKEKWNENPKKWAKEMIDKIKDELKGKCPKEIKIPGSECDFVGINKRGDLILLELKCSDNSTEAYLAPLQVGMYGELVTNLLNSYKTDVEKAIFDMLEQKKKLKMLSPKWKTPTRLSGNVRLAVVVGGDSSNVVKRRFKVVRDVIHKDVSHYTCKGDGTLKEVNPFKEGERDKHIEFITKQDKRVFGEVKGYGRFRGKKRYSFILKEEYVDKNLFVKIRNEAKEYFRDNGIKWWEEKNTIGEAVPSHTLSSQIACLNHLFRIRNDKEAVKAMLNGINENYQFSDIKEIESDEHHKGYIAFEAVSDHDHLGEAKEGEKLTRGSKCTSIDALINAVDNDGNLWIVAIEWKYTESYKDEDKTCYTRMRRYNNLISSSKKYLDKPKDNKYEGSVYYQEPFYQLMRQTLWAVQMINKDNRAQERVKAEDYLHIHVVPKDNSVLLDRGFPKVGENMAETWRKCLTDEGKKRYIIIDPEVLLKPIEKFKEYRDLIKYLKTRYWRKYKKKK